MVLAPQQVGSPALCRFSDLAICLSPWHLARSDNKLCSGGLGFKVKGFELCSVG